MAKIDKDHKDIFFGEIKISPEEYKRIKGSSLLNEKGEVSIGYKCEMGGIIKQSEINEDGVRLIKEFELTHLSLNIPLKNA